MIDNDITTSFCCHNTFITMKCLFIASLTLNTTVVKILLITKYKVEISHYNQQTRCHEDCTAWTINCIFNLQHSLYSSPADYFV